MGREKAGFEIMPRMYSERAQFLHQQACYDGHTDDSDIPDLIYGTADYIRQAEQLAGS